MTVFMALSDAVSRGSAFGRSRHRNVDWALNRLRSRKFNDAVAYGGPALPIASRENNLEAPRRSDRRQACLKGSGHRRPRWASSGTSPWEAGRDRGKTSTGLVVDVVVDVEIQADIETGGAPDKR